MSIMERIAAGAILGGMVGLVGMGVAAAVDVVEMLLRFAAGACS